MVLDMVTAASLFYELHGPAGIFPDLGVGNVRS